MGCDALLLVTAEEAVDTACGIDELLLTGKERMALGANRNLGFLLRGTHMILSAATASYHGIIVIGRMDLFFHGATTFTSGYMSNCKGCTLVMARRMSTSPGHILKEYLQ